jgi:nucleoside-diphosphate-sugar epimerase
MSVYGIHKLIGERYLMLYQQLYGVRSTILRITNPYGPFQRAEQSDYGVVNWFIHQAMKAQVLPIYGDGRQLRDYVHVDDVVRAMLLAGHMQEADGKILNVGSGRGVSFVDMAELIIRTAGQGSLNHVDWPPDAARVETGGFVADVSLIFGTLGWKATVALESGVEDVIARYSKLAPAWL